MYVIVVVNFKLHKNISYRKILTQIKTFFKKFYRKNSLGDTPYFCLKARLK